MPALRQRMTRLHRLDPVGALEREADVGEIQDAHSSGQRRAHGVAREESEVLRARARLPGADDLVVAPVPQPFVSAVDVHRVRVPAAVGIAEGAEHRRSRPSRRVTARPPRERAIQRTWSDATTASGTSSGRSRACNAARSVPAPPDRVARVEQELHCRRGEAQRRRRTPPSFRLPGGRPSARSATTGLKISRPRFGETQQSRDAFPLSLNDPTSRGPWGAALRASARPPAREPNQRTLASATGTMNTASKCGRKTPTARSPVSHRRLQRGARRPPAATAAGCWPPGRARRRWRAQTRRPAPGETEHSEHQPEDRGLVLPERLADGAPETRAQTERHSNEQARARSTRRRGDKETRGRRSATSSELESFAIRPGARGARMSTMPVFQSGHETPRPRASPAPANRRSDSVRPAPAGSRIARAAAA